MAILTTSSSCAQRLLLGSRVVREWGSWWSRGGRPAPSEGVGLPRSPELEKVAGVPFVPPGNL